MEVEDMVIMAVESASSDKMDNHRLKSVKHYVLPNALPASNSLHFTQLAFTNQDRHGSNSQLVTHTPINMAFTSEGYNHLNWSI